MGGRGSPGVFRSNANLDGSLQSPVNSKGGKGLGGQDVGARGTQSSMWVAGGWRTFPNFKPYKHRRSRAHAPGIPEAPLLQNPVLRDKQPEGPGC